MTKWIKYDLVFAILGLEMENHLYMCDVSVLNKRLLVVTRIITGYYYQSNNTKYITYITRPNKNVITIIFCVTSDYYNEVFEVFKTEAQTKRSTITRRYKDNHSYRYVSHASPRT
jgi:hypothetical protein